MHAADIDELMRLPLLEREEERALMRAWVERRCPKAHSTLWRHYGRLAIMWAKKYRRYGLPREDLIGEANVGLGVALQRFELNHDVLFGTYAQYWIRARLGDYVVRHMSIVAPARSAKAKTLVNSLRRIEADLDRIERGEQPNGTSGDPFEELATRYNVPAELVRRLATTIGTRDRSIDAPVGDGELTLADTLASADASPEELAARNEELERMFAASRRAIDNLESRRRRIIEARWLHNEGNPTSLDVLAEEMGISRERVRQLENEALDAIGEAVAPHAPDGKKPLPGRLITQRPRALRRAKCGLDETDESCENS